jgi:hypothetical protein
MSDELRQDTLLAEVMEFVLRKTLGRILERYWGNVEVPEG